METTRILIVDDDPDLLESMSELFTDEGYAVTGVPSVDAALASVERETFAFVLSDIFEHSPSALQQLLPLRDAAYPTPVGVSSAWHITADEVAAAGFACFVPKPFNISDALTTVAQAIHRPFSPEQLRQEHTLRAFVACVGAHDWDGALRLCSEDVVYSASYGPPGNGAPVVGRVAYRAYAEAVGAQYPRYHVTAMEVAPTPLGLAARYTAEWDAEPLTTTTLGLVVEFDAKDLLSRIGVRFRPERLRVLQSAT